MKFVEPKFEGKAFTCPYCDSYSQQDWSIKSITTNFDKKIIYNAKLDNSFDTVSISTCQYCGKYHLWHNDRMIHPSNSPIPMPLEDMPEVVKELYIEAREVYIISFKSSCALLRLAVQHLCKELGEKGKNINEDIGNLVKKGLPEQIQMALDIVRVVGNNAVHPGTMDEEDTKEYAIRMFSLLNFIVEDRIIRPKEIEKLYNGLPYKALRGIENRDKDKVINQG
ncbi:DUF4145 domain-containing protein [Clostridium baratii]